MQKQLRVLICIRHFLPAVGGAEIQAFRFAQALQQRGIHTVIVTGRYSDDPKEGLVGTVPVHRLFVGVYRPIVHELFFLVSFAWYLIRYRDEYDLIQLFQLQLSTLVAVVIGRQFLGKVVVTRSSGTKGSGVAAVWNSVPVHRFLLGHIGRNVDAVVALSPEMERELQDAGFPQGVIRRVSNGVPPFTPPAKRVNLRRSLGIADDQLILISVGRLTALKQHSLLIDALAKLINEKRKASLCLILLGDGEEREALQARAREKGLSELVHFPGTVSNVDDYLAKADIFALPSSYEGMSNALLEAMAAGLPVVATRTGGTTEVIQNGRNGLLFDAGDLCALTAHLSTLADRPELREELGRNAARTIEERYTIEQSAERYIDLYRDILARRELGKR